MSNILWGNVIILVSAFGGLAWTIWVCTSIQSLKKRTKILIEIQDKLVKKEPVQVYYE